ncbi:MAG: PorT family protein [Flavipsychrobacter sp.]|nr:PorT family protein [Flavipsychrobacter sp.]
MKKTIITLGLTMLAGITAFGQEAQKTTKPSYASLGPVGGFGHSWMSNMDGQQFKPSAHLGVAFIYSRYEHWGWGANLTASHEGYSNEYMWGGDRYRRSVDPVYLRLAPRAYYFFGSYGDNVRPKLYLGPSVGVKVQEDQYTTNITNNTTDAVMATPTNTQMYRTMDLGAEGGAGVNVKVAPRTWLNLDANYYQGLLDVTKNGATHLNQNVRFNVGVMMGL